MMRERVWLVLLVVLIQATFPESALAQDAPRCVIGSSYPRGTVLALEGTPHLWVLEGGEVHWGGDTRALAGRNVRWDSRCAIDLDFLFRVTKGDPFLSSGLVKIGDPIYLAKWETNESQPTLFHIQSITDVELFGINASNYTRFVLEREEWQRRFPFNTDALRREELAQVAPSGARLPPPAPTRPPAPPTPQPTSPPPSAFPVVQAPRPFPQFPCLAANPSCGRDPWWVEWNELTRMEPVGYAFAPGLVTEAKYIEAVWLLWLWPEGRELLQHAAANGVVILTMNPQTLPRLTVAVYSPSLNAVGVNPAHMDVSTWMLRQR